MGHDDLFVSMNAPLLAAYRSIRALLAQAGRAEVSARHEIGTIVVDIKRSRHKYGTQAVGRLAKAVGTDEQTLYRCASVAECWTKAQIQALLERTNEFGQPLSWSHFVVLTGVSAAQRRAELFDRAVRESLSVRALSALVESPSEASAEPHPNLALERLVRTADRLARELESIHGEIVSNLPKRQRGGQHSVLEQAIAATERLQAVVGEHAERLKAQREKLDAGPSDRPLPRLLVGMP